MTITGWDIGGVNTKVARVNDGVVIDVRSRAYELQRDPAALAPLLRDLAIEVGSTSADVHAVTMTAELSQMFRTKREGVSFVLDAVELALPPSSVHVYATDGRFLTPAAAREQPLAVAAANWAATARLVGRSCPNALLVDIGTTSTDIIPIVGEEVVASGWTDPDRLASGELVYTGAVRTPVEAMASHVPFGDRQAGVSAEGFALAGDVHVWLGDLAPEDYSYPAPDGRPATREFAGERLARAICADRDMIDAPGITAIAEALSHAQVVRIADAITQVCRRHPTLDTAVVTGLGAFIAERAARRAGLNVIHLSSALGNDGARCAPAASVALLLAGKGAGALTADAREGARVVHTVIKVGGGLLAHDGCFEAVLDTIREMARDRTLVVVPGGGPFADAVRAEDERRRLSDDAAHWMAVLAMDQYAHLIASRLAESEIVAGPREIAGALHAGRVPVLAPSTWLRREDPLPHSWEVTSDSIAAWIARQLGARQLVLVKPPHAAGPDVVDPHFFRVHDSRIALDLVAANDVERAHRIVPGA